MFDTKKKKNRAITFVPIQENYKDPTAGKRIPTAVRCWFRPPLQRTRRYPLLSLGAGGAATMYKNSKSEA